MVGRVKRFLYKRLSMENYLRVLQQGYFFAYNTYLLRASRKFDSHYYVRNLINKGDTIIDIGANLGYYSILFSRWSGKGGHVYSVEPVEIFNKVFMRKARKRKNITLLPFALGSAEGSVELVASLDSEVGYLQTGEPHLYDKKRDGARESNEFIFQAQMRMPSKLFGELKRIDYIKCDIEGAELQVLSDMLPLITRHRPIVQVEVWDENEEPIMAMFKSLSYIPSKVSGGRLLCDSAGVEGDYIFMPSELSFNCV